MRLVHQKYSIYVDGTILDAPTRSTVLIDDRNANTLAVRDSREGDIMNLSEVTMLAEKRERRLHQLTWVGTNAEGDEVTITGIKRGCGCGGR